jgi:hypothetical protein
MQQICLRRNKFSRMVPSDLYGTRPNEGRKLWSKLMNSFRKGNVFRPSVLPIAQTLNGIGTGTGMYYTICDIPVRKLDESVWNTQSWQIT